MRVVADLIVFPAHALLIVEERLREQEAEGVRMPEGVPVDELALRVLIAQRRSRRGLSLTRLLDPAPLPTPLADDAVVSNLHR